MDEEGTETNLTGNITMCIKFDWWIQTVEDAFEIVEIDKKMNTINFLQLKKYLNKSSFGITNAYFSRFNKTLFLDGGVNDRRIQLFIEGVKDVIFEKK